MCAGFLTESSFPDKLIVNYKLNSKNTQVRAQVRNHDVLRSDVEALDQAIRLPGLLLLIQQALCLAIHAFRL